MNRLLFLNYLQNTRKRDYAVSERKQKQNKSRRTEDSFWQKNYEWRKIYSLSTNLQMSRILT